MKLLFENWRQYILNEAAMGAQDLPENWFIKVEKDLPGRRGKKIKTSLIQKDEDGNFSRVPGRNSSFSVVTARHSTGGYDHPCLGAYIVTQSTAPAGFGPLLYDITLELAGKNGVTPDRAFVSDDAFRVWDYYLNNRNDIRKAQLDDPDNTLTPQDKDNCEQESNIDHDPDNWDISPISKVYYKDNQDILNQLRDSGKLIEGEAPGLLP
tara:strand:- start:76 stop:702 length:627 start_codon:yes stop_codon:yes gene_type:complete